MTEEIRADNIEELERAVYVISVAAELAGMHAQTLRMYERRGLINPGRTAGGSRRYSELDVKRLQRIGDLTSTGLNLEGVKRVVELEEQVRVLELTVANLVKENRELKGRYQRDIVPVQDMATFPVWKGSQK